jgi:hypothetical protein
MQDLTPNFPHDLMREGRVKPALYSTQILDDPKFINMVARMGKLNSPWPVHRRSLSYRSKRVNSRFEPFIRVLSTAIL